MRVFLSLKFYSVAEKMKEFLPRRCDMFVVCWEVIWRCFHCDPHCNRHKYTVCFLQQRQAKIPHPLESRCLAQIQRLTLSTKTVIVDQRSCANSKLSDHLVSVKKDSTTFSRHERPTWQSNLIQTSAVCRIESFLFVQSFALAATKIKALPETTKH